MLELTPGLRIMSFSDHFCGISNRDPEPEHELAVFDLLSRLVKHNKVIFTEMAKQTFSGSKQSTDILGNLIADGKALSRPPRQRLQLEGDSKWLTPGYPNASMYIFNSDSRYTVARLFYTVMIPRLWWHVGWYPVLIDTRTPCNSTKPISLVKNDNSKVCFNDRRYYLLRMARCRHCSIKKRMYSQSCLRWRPRSSHKLKTGYDQRHLSFSMT